MNVQSRLQRVRDIVRDVIVEMHARRTRTILMIIAVALSTGTLISAVSISATAARQVDADLAASTLNLVSVVAAPGQSGEKSDAKSVFPADAEERAESVEMVLGAGRRLDVTGLTTAAIARSGTPSLEEVTGLTLSGLTSGYVRATETTVSTESSWMLDADAPVVFLGAQAAATLNIPVTADPTGFQVAINGVDHSVIGFLDGGSTDMSNIVAIPYGRAVQLVGNDNDARLLVRTELGAGAVVAPVIRLALRPDAPEHLASSQIVNVADLRTGVSTQLGRLAAWIGGLLLMLTILLVANAMVVSVMARTSEVGVRRALGASRGSVSALFITEGALSGGLGGLAGSAIATVAGVVVAIASGWSAVFEPTWVILGPAVGIGAGLISSLYPALRAAAIQPAQAVRSD